MAEILCFSRNRNTGVEQIDETTMRASCSLRDTLTEARVEIMVTLPDLEITDAKGELRRSVGKADQGLEQFLRRVVGVRIGPGMKKIVRGLLGRTRVEKQLGFMVEECCDGIILAFSKDVLKNAPRERLEEVAFFQDMVRSNPRLYNSCAALAPGSPLVEGIDSE